MPKTIHAKGPPVVHSKGGPWYQAPVTGSVVREEIREMALAMRERYAQAIEKMMRNDDGPASSQYLRLARIHDEGPCKHGEETFPVWHRAYLHDFELTLRRADLANGNDGNIGLPYWDWTEKITHKGECLPGWMRKRWAGLPSSVDAGTKYDGKVSYNLRSEGDMKAAIEGSRAAYYAQQTLLSHEHWKAASKRYARGANCESSHDAIHMACGGCMTAVDTAAFHPIFFLHHCNVDRIYESYLHVQGKQESMDQFREMQAEHATHGEENRFETKLHPFTLNGHAFMPKDAFDIDALGYSYNRLVSKPPAQMRQVPTYAMYVFDVRSLKKMSYELHAFVVKKGSQAEFMKRFPSSYGDIFKLKEYAGMGASFGGKEPSNCPNCATRKPYVVRVDVTTVLIRQRLSRADAFIVTWAIENNENGQVTNRFFFSSPNKPAALKQPSLVGPLFESGRNLSKDAADGQHDTNSLQGYLKRFGYYSSEVDGKFGAKTEEAIKTFQRNNGLPVTGQLDAPTRAQMASSRLDGFADEPTSKANFAPGSSIKWFVSPGVPTYLTGPGGAPARDALLTEVRRGVAEWNTALGEVNVRLVEAYSIESADVTFSFSENAVEPLASQLLKRQVALAEKETREDKQQEMGPAEVLGFDGPGGELAHATKNSIVFDRAERWRLQSTEMTDPVAFEPHFLEVFLHELGHVIGLSHSTVVTDVMSPYYVVGQTQLAQGDKEALKQLYANTEFTTYEAPKAGGGICSCFGGN